MTGGGFCFALPNTQGKRPQNLRLKNPQENYSGAILGQLRFVAERALADAGTDTPGRYTPLDTLQCFRRMLGAHLLTDTEIDRTLKRCRNADAFELRRELREVEFAQSRYDSWEPQYLQGERRYHQIAAQIGKITGNETGVPRSAWETRGLLLEDFTPLAPYETGALKPLRWQDMVRFREALTGRPRREREIPPREAQMTR